jgi:hypothetical protein
MEPLKETRMSKVPTSELLQSAPNLPNELIGLCDKYYILYWESRYLYTQIFRGGRIIRQGVSYTPHLKDGLTLQELSRNPEAQIRISFRRLRGKIGGDAVITRTPIITVKKVHHVSNPDQLNLL